MSTSTPLPPAIVKPMTENTRPSGRLARGGGRMPPPWITYAPLLPLALLLFTGLYLFVLPYAVAWRSGRRTGVRGAV